MKKKSSTWKIVVGVLLIVGGIMSFGEDIAAGAFGVVAGAALVFWWKKSKDAMKREEEKRVAEERARKYKFKVVGVTHSNDDGTSRQEALEQIYNDGKKADVSFKSFTFQGDPALYVMAGESCVGCVAADCVFDVTALIKTGRTATMSVDKFVNESGETVYYASFTL